MDEERQRRLAGNEDLFRRANEAVVQGMWPGEVRGPLRLRCECASLDCSETIEIGLDAYAAVRSHPDRFVLCDGHEVPELEQVVEHGPGYAVVQKLGSAAEEAERSDSGSGA